MAGGGPCACGSLALVLGGGVPPPLPWVQPSTKHLVGGGCPSPTRPSYTPAPGVCMRHLDDGLSVSGLEARFATFQSTINGSGILVGRINDGCGAVFFLSRHRRHSSGPPGIISMLDPGKASRRRKAGGKGGPVIVNAAPGRREGPGGVAVRLPAGDGPGGGGATEVDHEQERWCTPASSAGWRP